jgi:hypothetical protein
MNNLLFKIVVSEVLPYLLEFFFTIKTSQTWCIVEDIFFPAFRCNAKNASPHVSCCQSETNVLRLIVQLTILISFSEVKSNGIPFFKIGTFLGGNEINSLSRRVVKVESEIRVLSLREQGAGSYIPSRSCVYTVHPSPVIRAIPIYVTWESMSLRPHHSELHVITALSLISTLYRSLSLAQYSPANSVSDCRVLATTSNSGDSSVSRAHVVTDRRISHNWTHSAGLWSSHYSLGADPTENTASNTFYGRLPSDSQDIVSAGMCLPSRCSEMVVCLFAHCIATVVLIVLRSLPSNGSVRHDIVAFEDSTQKKEEKYASIHELRRDHCIYIGVWSRCVLVRILHSVQSCAN